MPKTTQILSWRQRRDLRKKGGGRRGLFWLGGAVVVVVALFIGLVGFLWLGGTAVYTTLTDDLPDYDQLSQWDQNQESIPTQIFAWTDASQTETILIDEMADPLNGERQWLPLTGFPQGLVDATIAAEEPGFWSGEIGLGHVGRELATFVLDGGTTVAAPPILQQAVRANLIPPDKGVFWQKVEELLLAHRASGVYSREQILEWYLNTRYYGHLAFGAEAAARVYFDKAVADLTLAESALLAASSATINPIDALDEVKVRQADVLAGMVEAGFISRGSAQAAQNLLVTVSTGITSRTNIIAPHFALYARQELMRRYDPEMLLAGGLRVFTSLNLALQGQAECTARAQVNKLSGQIGPPLPADELVSCAALDFMPPLDTAVVGLDQQVNNAAVIVLDAKTGEIRAMVGSVNYWDDDIGGAFNVAVDGRRQPGSTFTPFTYLTALSQGYTASTMVLDVETDFGTAVTGVPNVPQNADGQFHGPMRLRQALASDYYVPAVQVASWVSMDKIINTARSLGLTTLAQTPDSYDFSLNLGGGEVSLLDMTYAYAVLANMGVMVGEANNQNGRFLDPVVIVRVEDQAGSVLYDYYERVQQRDILTPQLAYLMNDMLADRSARCAAFGCPNVMELPGSRPAAVKTGTTNDFRDAWTIGYTPQLVTGVWVGNSENRVMDGVTGVTGAAPIWQAVMAWALQDEPVVLWSQPPGLVETAVCDISGLLATDACSTVSELFIQGTQPTVFDTIYQEIAVNRETGRLATIYTPPELVENRIYKIYPEAAADWAQEAGVEAPPTEYDTISAPDTATQDAAISFPQPLSVISGTITIRGTARSEDFAYYRLAYFAGLNPANLQSIVENETKPKTNQPLAVWDTGDLDGLYTLLLTVVGQDGRFEEISIPVTIDNDAHK